MFLNLGSADPGGSLELFQGILGVRETAWSQPVFICSQWEFGRQLVPYGGATRFVPSALRERSRLHNDFQRAPISAASLLWETNIQHRDTSSQSYVGTYTSLYAEDCLTPRSLVRHVTDESKLATLDFSLA